MEPIEGIDLETYVRLSVAHVRGAAPPERWDDVRRAWMERISTDERVRDAYAELYRRAAGGPRRDDRYRRSHLTGLLLQRAHQCARWCGHEYAHRYARGPKKGCRRREVPRCGGSRPDRDEDRSSNRRTRREVQLLTERERLIRTSRHSCPVRSDVCHLRGCGRSRVFVASVETDGCHLGRGSWTTR